MSPKTEIETLAAELRAHQVYGAITEEALRAWADRLDQIAAGLPTIPTNWLDPLLTGPDAVIGNPPYNCRDIERLLRAIHLRARMWDDSDWALVRRNCGCQEIDRGA